MVELDYQRFRETLEFLQHMEHLDQIQEDILLAGEAAVREFQRYHHLNLLVAPAAEEMVEVQVLLLQQEIQGLLILGEGVEVLIVQITDLLEGLVS
jgi:hypothetical protein